MGFAMTMLGGALTLYGMARRGPMGTIVGGIGTSLIAKAFADTDNRQTRVTRQPMSGGKAQPTMPVDELDATPAG
jgi:uncharacterized membrane protein